MRITKAQFKYALRSVRKSEEMIKADALASDLLNNDYDSFWKDVMKLKTVVIQYKVTITNYLFRHMV